jgi:hypothetical protein
MNDVCGSLATWRLSYPNCTLQFDKIGSLDFEHDSLKTPIFTIGPCNVLDEVDAMEPVINPANFQKLGPFDLFQQHFEALLGMQKTAQDDFSIRRRHLLSMMIRCMALINWDNAHTIPHCTNYSRCPAWSTRGSWGPRNWDPVKHGYGLPDCRPENSPAEFEYHCSRQ